MVAVFDTVIKEDVSPVLQAYVIPIGPERTTESPSQNSRDETLEIDPVGTEFTVIP
jgi:hypothetical protein